MVVVVVAIASVTKKNKTSVKENLLVVVVVVKSSSRSSATDILPLKKNVIRSVSLLALKSRIKKVLYECHMNSVGPISVCVYRFLTV